MELGRGHVLAAGSEGIGQVIAEDREDVVVELFAPACQVHKVLQRLKIGECVMCERKLGPHHNGDVRGRVGDVHFSLVVDNVDDVIGKVRHVVKRLLPKQCNQRASSPRNAIAKEKPDSVRKGLSYSQPYVEVSAPRAEAPE